jgi:hypothetical protein
MIVKTVSARNPGSSKSVAGLLMVVAGFVVFVQIVHQYLRHMAPIVLSQNAALDRLHHDLGPRHNRELSHILSPASLDVAEDVQSVIEEQIVAIGTRQYPTALNLATKSYHGLSPYIYAAFVGEEETGLLKHSWSFGETAVLPNKHVAIQIVLAYMGDQRLIQYTFVLAKQSNRWKIYSVQRGNWLFDRVAAQYQQLDLPG